MLKQILFTAALLHLSFMLFAQGITISGKYLDKKSQPISNALVSYFTSDNLMLNSTHSLADGSFELSVSLTGINSNINNNSFIKLPHPNPFNGLCNFIVNINSQVNILISDLQGRMVDKYEINTPGQYNCFWGGKNRIGQPVSEGIYNISIIADNQVVTYKVNFIGNASQRIKAEKISNNNVKSNKENQDYLSFLKENTSNLILSLNPIRQDTNIEIITGNTGPNPLANIEETYTKNFGESFNLNNYFYNDDQSIYSQNNSDFSILQDTLLRNSDEVGTYTTSVTATDPIDATLIEHITANVLVLEPVVVSGYISDIFDDLNIGIEGVEISMTLDYITYYFATTDANGFYSIQLPANETETLYYATTIHKEAYTPFHSWATVDANNKTVTENYTIIPSTFVWSLYNGAFRSVQGLGGSGFPTQYAVTTRSFLSPPALHTVSDNSLVGGQSITTQYNNLVLNIQTILPTFNPRDVIPSNLVQHTSFGYYLQDNEFGAYFDNSISGNGVVFRIFDGPKMNKCSTAYVSGVGLTGPDVSTFNQELGSCFGAVLEPPQSASYVSVFTDPAGSNTYTTDDYDCAEVMLDRARVHYVNTSVSGENSYDWEMNPSDVQIWYPGTSKSTKISNEIVEYKVVDIDGKVIESGTYNYDEVPSRVMKMAKIIFTPEEIAKKEKQEKKEIDDNIIIIKEIK